MLMYKIFSTEKINFSMLMGQPQWQILIEMLWIHLILAQPTPHIPYR